MKQVKWHFDHICADVSGTNIQKSIFRKRDLIEKVYQEYIDKSSGNQTRKRDLKAAGKEGDDQTEKSGLATDWEEINEAAGLENS